MAKTIIKTKISSEKFNRSKDSKWYSMIGYVKVVGQNCIQVRRRGGQARFWFDTTDYENAQPLDTPFNKEDFLNQEVEVLFSVQSYVNKHSEYGVRLHLETIRIVDAQTGYAWEHEKLPYEIPVRVKAISQTAIPGLFILSSVRVENGEEMETYNFRYYTSDRKRPAVGDYNVKFTLSNTSQIVETNGEVYNHEEEYETTENEETVTRRSLIYVPVAQVTELTSL